MKFKVQVRYVIGVNGMGRKAWLMGDAESNLSISTIYTQEDTASVYSAEDLPTIIQHSGYGSRFVIVALVPAEV